MEQLRLGFISTEELASWANLSASSLEKNKKRWCEKNLNKYATFELKRGGVIINKIFEPMYIGSGYKEVQTKYDKYYGHDTIKADTAKNCWNKLEPHMNNKIKETTGINYVGKARVEDYGTARKTKKRYGNKGLCRFVFGKIIDGEFYPFSEEEEKIKKELSKTYFSDMKFEIIEEQQALNWALKHKEITVEEYAVQMQELLDKETNWIDFQQAFEKIIQNKTDFRVLIEKCAWNQNNTPEQEAFLS